MKAMFKRRVTLALAVLALTCSAAMFHRNQNHTVSSADTILLLLPDTASDKDAQVQLWLDAASEEGLHMQVVRDSALLDPMFQVRSAGLVVPDQVHREANDALVGALHRYVEQGGRLMLVYDACTWDLRDRYAARASRLSDLAGVDYGLYDRFGTESITSGPVWGSTSAMQALSIPPGSYMPQQPTKEVPRLRQVALRSGSAGTEDRQELVGYLYGELEYPRFQTAGEFQGKALLKSATGLVAGEKKHGAGAVLFVNLPLGYLVTRTDGLLLHSFLRYFAFHMLHLPTLASVPDGVGGLVMNWHIDAESALKPMAVLRKAGIFDHGPFSFDITAGPDVDEFHDGKGLNLDRNPQARAWVEFLRAKGDEIGSHGGWIHNYFGRNVSDSNEDSFEQYLLLNKKAVENIAGSAVTEYSAPMGNHPEWVTQWLERNKVVAYYFTGDAGMGPTRVYREHGRDGNDIWAFPILHFGSDACLEEMRAGSLSSAAVANWLMNVTDFASQLHVARLLYSHPIGAVGYTNALQKWLQHDDQLAARDEFRWYTMTELARFLNARQEVSWHFAMYGVGLELTANHPRTLQHQAWMVPDQQYQHPKIEEGAADIRDQDGYWIIAAKDCKRLKVGFAHQQSDTAQTSAGN